MYKMKVKKKVEGQSKEQPCNKPGTKSKGKSTTPKRAGADLRPRHHIPLAPALHHRQASRLHFTLCNTLPCITVTHEDTTASIYHRRRFRNIRFYANFCRHPTRATYITVNNALQLPASFALEALALANTCAKHIAPALRHTAALATLLPTCIADNLTNAISLRREALDCSRPGMVDTA